MRAVLRDNWALFTGLVAFMIANGLLVTLLTIRGAALGFSSAEIGVMQAGYPLGALFGSVATPKLIERVGHVRAFGALASLCSVAAVVHLMTESIEIWTLMRMLAGFCFPGLYVISESWLNAKTPNDTRAAVLSIYFVTQIGASALGQALAGYEDPSGDVMFGVASILISLSLVPLLVSRGLSPAFVAPARLGVLELARISPTGVLGATFNGAAQAVIYVTAPLYALALNLDAAASAALVAVATLAGAAAQFPLGWASDRIDRRIVIAASAAAAAAVATLALLFDPFGPFGTTALIAAATLPLYSLCVAHANDQLKPEQIVPASGALVLALNVGILIGAVAGPSAVGAFGAAGFLALVALMNAATVGIALTRRAQTPRPEETGVAQPISAQGAQRVTEMSPMGDD